jgi:hypothetical protein
MKGCLGVTFPDCERLLAAVLGLVCALAGAAHAACGDEDRIRCRPDFEVIKAVLATGDGFTAAGQVKSTAASGLALLRLGRGGEARGVVPVPWPTELTFNEQAIADPRRLIALANGDVVLLAQIFPDQTQTRQFAAVTRIAANGRIVWTRSFPEATTSVVFDSGYYDSKGDRLILVGRRQLGPDMGRCENWSQSMVVTMAASDGRLVAEPLIQGEQGRARTNRQAIFDLTPDGTTGNFVVTGFFTAPHGTDRERCQDNIFVGTLTQIGNRWTLARLGAIGTNTADEVAFSIKTTADGFYLLAGYGRDEGAPAAQAYRVRLRPFAVQGLLSEPFPKDGSDMTGGDRYRVIVPLAEKDRFLLAGSVSTSAQASNRAFWQTVTADLKSADPLVLVNNTLGSDIFDAALSPTGQVLAVGRWTDEGGRRVGWTGFISGTGAGGAPMTGAGGAPMTLDRRPPDSRLMRLSSLPFAGGAYRLPAAAAVSGVGFYDEKLEAGSQVDLAFSVATARALKISAHTETGDVDLVVSDARKRPVSFSNFKGTATELLIATLPPGDYTISLVAQTTVGAYEFRIAPFQEINTKVLAKLQELSEPQRQQLFDALVAAGYTPPGNLSIALGSESARALLAAQEGAGRDIGPGGIGRGITQDLSVR